VLDADDAFALDVARPIALAASVDIARAFDDAGVRRTPKSAGTYREESGCYEASRARAS